MNFTITHITKDKVFAKEVNPLKKPDFQNYPSRKNIMGDVDDMYFIDLNRWQEAENNLKEYELTEDSLIQNFRVSAKIDYFGVNSDYPRFYEIGQVIQGEIVDGKIKVNEII